MKIQCDVCEKAPATVICCADEAALCAGCDVQVHAANKLASKHQRLLLHFLSNYKLPRCDICQKAAFIFCVEDRALFCQDCDEPIHSAHTISGNHQRFLATGIRVGLSSNCANGSHKGPFEPPSQTAPQVPTKTPSSQQQDPLSRGWGVEELLQLSEFDPSDKKDQLQFGELDWLADMGLLGEQITHHPETLTAAEVPQLPVSQPSNFPTPNSRTNKLNLAAQKKQRIEVLEDDDEEEEHFAVPDLGLD